jgi:hypothetical protein
MALFYADRAGYGAFFYTTEPGYRALFYTHITHETRPSSIQMELLIWGLLLSKCHQDGGPFSIDMNPVYRVCAIQMGPHIGPGGI